MVNLLRDVGLEGTGSSFSGVRWLSEGEFGVVEFSEIFWLLRAERKSNELSSLMD